jgi:hypothetical protein
MGFNTDFLNTLSKVKDIKMESEKKVLKIKKAKKVKFDPRKMPSLLKRMEYQISQDGLSRRFIKYITYVARGRKNSKYSEVLLRN